jgi:flagellar basal-body rod protein FlgF
MIRGLYTAATGMTVQRAKMDVLTNNIVNSSTTGYKRDTLVSSSFEEVMIERIGDPNILNTAREVGPFSFGTHIDEVFTDFAPGSVENTGAQTDLAISGEGFFVVDTPDGERYTRNGNFTVNPEGFLMTSDGYYVLGENGRVNVGSGGFEVDAGGNVAVEGEARDTLRVVQFQETAGLRKQGDSLYYAIDGAIPAAAENSTVMQGYLEGSNVDIADEMVDMMTVYRTYEASQKILTMTDETLGMAVNNLGSLR